MKYPSEFPRAARARVEAATLIAYAALEEEVRGMPARRDDAYIRCVLQVFMAFAREACEYSKKSNHWAWSDRELDQRCREFLLWTVVETWEDKAKNLGIRKIFSSRGWGNSIDDDGKRRMENSSEWKQYQGLLLLTYEGSARAEESRLQRDEKAHGTPGGAETVTLASIDAPGAAKSQVGSLGGGRSSSQIPEGPPVNSVKSAVGALRWEDIEISFVSDERVLITIGLQTETLNYAEMDFASKQNGTPVKGWIAFRSLAVAGGVALIAADSGKWAEFEKRIQEIRKVLRHRFGLTGDPIPYVKKRD